MVAPLVAQDWPNYGGGPARNGQTDRFGPTTPALSWSDTNDFSVIAWHPFVADDRVITVRESGFPGVSANDEIVAYDRSTGLELWRTSLPYGGDSSAEWIAWVGGISQGRVLASRSDNGRLQPIRALDAATGQILWTSQISTNSWAHDGMVFTDDGDPIVGDRQTLTRVDIETGQTVWSIARSCSVSGNCGAARSGDSLYIDEAAPGGQVLTKIDAASGAVLYSSPLMPGFSSQNQPFVAPDGATVYFARTQNNDLVDALYAFEDTGTSFVERWNRPVRWTTRHEHGIGPDGTIYTFLPGDEFVGLDPQTGNVIHTAGVLAPIGTGLSPQTAVAADGVVYVSNGWASSPASDGRLWAFPPTLGAPLFTLDLNRQNAGGPALAGQGELIVADRDGVFAYRTPGPTAACTPRFGSGVNPVAYTCSSAPNVYGGFQGAVATDASTLLTAVVVSLSAPAVGVPFAGGELLVDLPFVLLDVLPESANGQHQLPIPGTPSLLGATLATQAARVDLVGALELGNALDLTLGY